MTDQQFTDLISKIEMLANAMTQRRNSSPVSPADTQPIAAPHNTTDLKSMRERLNHLESERSDAISRYSAERHRERQLQSIIGDKEFDEDKDYEDSRGNKEKITIESRFQHDTTFRKKLDEYKEVVLKELESEIAHIVSQIRSAYALNLTVDEYDALVVKRQDLEREKSDVTSMSSLSVAQRDIKDSNELLKQSNIVNELRERAKLDFIASYRYSPERGRDFYGDEKEDDNSDGKASANVKKRDVKIRQIEAQLEELSQRWDDEFEDYLEKEQWARQAQLQKIKESLQARLDKESELKSEVKDNLIKKLKETDDAINKERGRNARESKKARLEEEKGKQESARSRAQSVVDKETFFDFISGGKSGKLGKQGESWIKAGDAMSKVGGKVGKFGGLISKAGGMLTKFAGPVGIAIQAMQMFADAANAIAEGLAKTGEFINKEQQYQFEYKKRLIELGNTQYIEDMGAIADIRKTEMDRDGRYQIEQAKLRNMEYIGAAETQVGAITDGINNAAWSAAYKRLEIETQRQIVENEQIQREQQASFAISERKGQNMAVHEQTIAGQNTALVDYINKSERNAMDRQHWIQNNPFTANAIGEDNNLGMGLLLLNPSVEGLRKSFGDKKNNSIDAAGTDFTRNSEISASIKNPLTNEKYELGHNFEQSAISRTYSSYDAIQRTAGNWLGLNKVGQTLDNQYMATRQWEREELAKTFELDAKLRYDAYNNQLKGVYSVYNKQMEYATEVRNENIKTATEIKKNWMKLAQSTEQWTDKFDKTIRETAMRNGIHNSEGQMRGYEKGMMGMYSQLARKWNVDIEEIMQMQSTYSDSTGRNYILGDKDYDKSTAIGKFVGDMGVGTAIGTQMEIFNVSVADAADLTMEVVKNVEKMGLSGQKYVKEIAKHLKMAEKYHFKDGVRGLMEMAKWAQQTRFNMDSVPNILEKIQGGGLENNITAAAKLQVLGGRFAMGSDPLAMIWEGFNNPAGLTSRYNDMISGTGYWDSETGDVNFGMADQIRLRQFAEITGQDVDDVMNQQRQRIKGEKIGSLLDNFKDPDQKAMVTNKAFYDKDTKSWKVKLLDQTGEIKDKAVAELTAEDLKFLNPQNHDEKIENYWERLLPMVERLSGEQKGEQVDIVRQTIDNTLDAYQKRLNIAADEFANKQGEYAKTVMDLTNKTTQEFQGFMETLVNEEKTKSLAEANEQAIAEATAIATTASKIKDKFLEARDILDNMIIQTQEEHERGNDEDEMRGNNISISRRSTSELASDFLFGDVFSANTWRSGGELGKRAWNKVTSWFNDGISSASGIPMAIAASSVTPINDGEIAQTDPNDHAIFAKVGGPFDTLFNKTFVRIDDVYNMLHDSLNPSIEPKEYIPYKDVVIRELSAASGYINTSSNNGGEFRFEPLKVEMSGSLQIDGGNGQSVDLMNVLKENPMILRSLTEMISNAISSQMNGGRGVYNGGRMVSFK